MWYDTADLVTNIVLAIMYLGLFFLTAFCLASNHHPKTTMILIFTKLAIMGSFCRVIYFGIPNVVWKTNETPTDVERFTEEWWLTLLQTSFFMMANVTFYGTYGIIVFLWGQAYASLRRRHMQQQRFLRLYWTGIGSYAAAQVALVVVMVATSFFVFLIVHAVILCILSLLASIFFLYFYYRLDENSKMFFAARSESIGQRGEDSLRAQNHMEQERRNKLGKLMRVAFICAGTQTFRAIFLMYELYVAATKNPPRSFWWAILFAYYTVSEIFVTSAVLWILRTPRNQKKLQRRQKSLRPKFMKRSRTQTDTESLLSNVDTKLPSPVLVDQNSQYGAFIETQKGTLNANQVPSPSRTNG